MKRLRGLVDANDLLILAGLGLLGYALATVSWALASGVIGGLLLAVGLLGAWRKGAR